MLNIMIVDNEAAIRKGLMRCIRWETLDCQVVAQAEDGIDALEQFPLVQPDLVISDICMPGMDGLELARQISEQYPQTKVILLTGFPDFEYAQKAIAYRVVDFVLKPTNLEELTRAVEKAKARIAEERSSRELEQALASQSAQNLSLQRDLLLRELIRRSDHSYLFLLNRLAQLGLNLTSFFVLRLEVLPLDGGEPPADFQPWLRESQEVLAECLHMHEVFFVPRGDADCYAVVCAPTAAPLEERCLEAVYILGSLPRFSLCVGVSAHRDDALRMAEAAGEADQAAQFARYASEQPVISFGQMPQIPREALDRVYADLRLLKSAIENHNRTASRDILLRLFDFIRENKLPPETVRSICVYIHQFCIGLLFLPEASGDYLPETGLSALKQLMESDSIDGLEQGMLSFVAHMFDHTGGGKDDADSLIRTVQTYVAQNCGGDLSLENLAGQVFLSPSYLSRLFKRETGENLSTYVQNVRIEQAKTLLLTTELKAYEVAERVGIPDPVYFSRLFKKITGVKPKDFRREG